MAFAPALGTVMVVALLAVAATTVGVQAQLSYGYYRRTCPRALATIKEGVQRALYNDKRMGASLLRMHFHDCFVNGCDASILLDGGDSEKESGPNKDTVRGYEVIDAIKSSVDYVCGRGVVSCADILTVAARDSVALLGGPDYRLPLGRRDSRSPSASATGALPGPSAKFPDLLRSFQDQRLTLKDLVVLSGAHTLGYTKCQFARPRLQSSTNIDRSFSYGLQQRCGAPSWIDSVLLGLDSTPDRFDNYYFKALVDRRGVLPSDQELFRGEGGESDGLVRYYANDNAAFFRDFADSMVRMGNIRPLTGEQGEIRLNCRRPN